MSDCLEKGAEGEKKRINNSLVSHIGPHQTINKHRRRYEDETGVL